MPASGNEVVTITIGGGASGPIDISEFQYTAFTGVGAVATTTTPPGSGTGSDTLSVSIVANSLILETGAISNSIVNSCGSISLTDTNRYNNCDTSGSTGFGQQINEHGPFALSQTVSFTMGYSGWNPPGGFVHGLIEIQGAAQAGTTISTKCFGNCGNPAVTIAKTNSTHLINFNQSITLFYPFQSSLNGFFVNASVFVGKTYNNGQQITVGIYIAYSCPVGATPFTAACPGSLIVSNSFLNPAKGKITVTVPGSTTGIANGQNAAVAFSCLYAPCDINDTNTVVPISQTAGNMPPLISQSSSFTGTCSCLTGAWAYITGNVVTGVPTITPTNAACAGFLDCLLPNWVNSLCSNPTPTCTSISGMIWAGGLAIFFTFFTLKGWGEIGPAVGNVKLPVVDVFLFWGLVWMLAMGGLALTFVWIPLFFFLVVALMFGKHGTFL